jgi:predicted AAA+ superfamily ATPase
MFRRHAEPLILDALTDTRVVMVLGARQVGKTTLTKEIAAGPHPARVLSLDDQATRNAASNDPTSFIDGLSGPTLIDEVQHVPDLLFAIKASVDEDKTPGRFLLTGSANVLTAPKIFEALTGRIEVVNLWPLSQAEIEGTTTNFVDELFAARIPQISGAPVGRAAFVDRVAAGGYPEPRLRAGARRERWFENYLRTTFERDLRDVSEAHKLDEMPRLLRLLGSQAANLFSAKKIGDKLGLDHKTVQGYVKLLETVYLVKEMPAWRPGIGSREIQSSKVYVPDSGLLSFLLGADEARIANDDQVTGKILENFVAMEIIKHVDWAQTRVRQYHYRDGREEVDVVLETRSGDIAAVEVKAAATIEAKDYRPMEKLRDRRGKSFIAGVVLYCGAETLALGNRIWAVPINMLWT